MAVGAGIEAQILTKPSYTLTLVKLNWIHYLDSNPHGFKQIFEFLLCEECLGCWATNTHFFVERHVTEPWPEQNAAKVIFDALRKIDRDINPMDIRVTAETIVPDVSDTVFGYGHVRIGLGPSVQRYIEPLMRACNELIDYPCTRASGDGDLWFHGPLTALARADVEALATFMMNYRPTHTPYRGI
jgi:hypothetical protein